MNHTSQLRSSLAAGSLALALVLAGCGSDSDATDTTTAADASTDTTAADASTDTTAADATEDSGAAAAADGIAVSMSEWEVGMEPTVPAGANTFTVTNDGPENPHALAIVAGESYEALPQKDNGAIDTEALGADAVLGTTDRIEVGGSATLDVELEPGTYVFFCPIEFGPNSHAKAGQVLTVTVG